MAGVKRDVVDTQAGAKNDCAVEFVEVRETVGCLEHVIVDGGVVEATGE